MSTKSKSVIGACVTAVAGVLISFYIPAESQGAFLGVVGVLVGKLGFAQPGQSA